MYIDAIDAQPDLDQTLRSSNDVVILRDGTIEEGWDAVHSRDRFAIPAGEMDHDDYPGILDTLYNGGARTVLIEVPALSTQYVQQLPHFDRIIVDIDRDMKAARPEYVPQRLPGNCSITQITASAHKVRIEARPHA